MANVRILMWNIKFFAEAVVRDQNRLNRIINRVHPAGGGPSVDIFIIIEPNKFSNPVNVGQLVAGSSILGLQTIYYALRHRSVNWRMVPPRTLTTSTNKEVHGVFYFSTNVTFHGPDNMVVTAPAPLAALPPVLGLFGLGGLPVVHAYGANPGVMASVGRVRHTDDGLALAVPPANEVTFPNAGNRRPYLCRFQTTGVHPVLFNIYSHHASPESKYPQNSNGILAFATVHAIGAGRVRPVLITGDFNCCNMVDPCPNKPNSHHAAEMNAQNRMTGPNVHNYNYWTQTVAALRAACQASDAAEVASAAIPLNVVAAAQAVGPFVTAAQNAGNSVAAVVGPPANAPLLILTTAANTAVVNLGTATALNGAARAVVARNAAIAVANYLAANFNAPNYLTQYGVAVLRTATAIDQAGVHAGNAAAATNAVGAAVTNACGTLNNLLTPAEHLAATGAANNATLATALTANLAGLAKIARNAMRTVVELRYKTHIRQQLSSLKTPNAASMVNYRNHAFDHVLTAGFDAESAAGVVDVVGTDPGWGAATAGGHAGTFKAFFRRISKGAGSGAEGISDHMPVQITITLN